MIRPANLEDASAIATIHVRAWQAAYAGIVPAVFLASLSQEKKTEFWRRELAEKRSVVVTAVENGAVVGWAAGGVSRDADAKGASEIYAIYVLPECWARSIGTQLMRKIDEAISQSAGVTLWVFAQNQRAIGFYRKLGYEFDGAEKTIQLGGVNLPEVRLRKKEPNQAPEPTAPSGRGSS